MKRRFNKKLSLNKKTISNMTSMTRTEMGEQKGGYHTYEVPSCIWYTDEGPPQCATDPYVTYDVPCK